MALLAGEGATVVGVSRKPQDLDRIGPAVTSIAADLIEPDAARLVVDEVLDRHGRLDSLVNDVGAIQTRTAVLEVTDEDRHATFELNFHAAVRVSFALPWSRPSSTSSTRSASRCCLCSAGATR